MLAVQHSHVPNKPVLPKAGAIVLGWRPVFCLKVNFRQASAWGDAPFLGLKEFIERYFNANVSIFWSSSSCRVASNGLCFIAHFDGVVTW